MTHNMQQDAYRKSKSGFTLIELLVVISIISLLIAILLPALASARKSARAISCASQLRQIGVTVIVYCGDYQDYFPDTYISGGIPWYRAVTLNSRLEGNNAKQYNLFHCPERDNYTKPGDLNYDAIVRTNYAYNSYVGRLEWYDQWLAGGDSWKQYYGPKKQGGVLKPSDALLTVDGAGKDYLLVGTDKLSTFSFTAPTVDGVHIPAEDRTDFPHQNTLNGLFVDGHVQRIPDGKWPYTSYTCDWAKADNYTF